MATKKFLGLVGLTALWSKITALVGNYVPITRKVNNKPLNADITLSASDVGAAASAHTHNYAGSDSAGGAADSVKTSMVVKLNGGVTEGTDLFTYNGATAKTVNITPAAIGAATLDDIATAVAALNSVTIAIVSSLPATQQAEANKIYFVPISSSEVNNVYDEYVLIGSKFEKIGTTAVDLSGYLQDSDFEEITANEVNTLFQV